MKELYTENYKTLMKEIKGDITDGEIFPIPGQAESIFESDYTTKCNLQIQCNPYQIINGIFHRTRTKKFQNSHGNTNDPK